MKADKEKPKVPVAQFLIEHFAEGFRIPIIEACENTKDDPAENDIVKVCDDEIESLSCQSNGATASMAGKARNEKLKEKTDAKASASQSGFSPIHRPSQLKILMPVGTAMIIVEMAKKVFSTVIPTVNMW